MNPEQWPRFNYQKIKPGSWNSNKKLGPSKNLLYFPQKQSLQVKAAYVESTTHAPVNVNTELNERKSLTNGRKDTTRFFRRTNPLPKKVEAFKWETKPNKFWHRANIRNAEQTAHRTQFEKCISLNYHSCNRPTLVACITRRRNKRLWHMPNKWQWKATQTHFTLPFRKI